MISIAYWDFTESRSAITYFLPIIAGEVFFYETPHENGAEVRQHWTATMWREMSGRRKYLVCRLRRAPEFRFPLRAWQLPFRDGAVGYRIALHRDAGPYFCLEQ